MDTNKQAERLILRLHAKGYCLKFKVHNRYFECEQLSQIFKVDEIFVDRIYSFIPLENYQSTQMIFTVHTADGKRGVLLDGYGKSSFITVNFQIL